MRAQKDETACQPPYATDPIDRRWADARASEIEQGERGALTCGNAVLWAQTVPSWPMMAAEVRWWPSISHMRCSSTYVCHDILSGGLVAATTCKRRATTGGGSSVSLVGEESERSRTQVSRGTAAV
jgi:hypothetical protein